jgi:hypothetical protein
MQYDLLAMQIATVAWEETGGQLCESRDVRAKDCGARERRKKGRRLKVQGAIPPQSAACLVIASCVQWHLQRRHDQD